MRALALVAVLAGCASGNVGEAVDQGAHYAAGYAMAFELCKWGDAPGRVDTVMTFARAREDLQHPGSCKEGCELDLKYWRLGAEEGAKCE